ncbi:glycosyltransferase family 1 protein [Pigmentiphaga sp. D-2]|uniref:glycosyltransferase family 1 protein n=1 Tax=Pigmentiphaga sp. D-2 TaxID=1002116 RepID=UPI00104F7D10|nr:glycosyltransferase family 1 protein [Pigmentiphaga sp. D-2]
MIRVLHAALMLKASSGIINQMRWEQEAASQLNYPWTTKIFVPSTFEQTDSLFYNASEATTLVGTRSILDKVRYYFRIREEYYSWLLKLSDEYDALLLRYSTSDPCLASFIQKCKKPVFLVHHTLEIPELRALGGKDAPPRILSEFLLQKRNARHVRGILGVTDEIVRYQKNLFANPDSKSFYVYPNGIKFKPTNKTEPSYQLVPNIVFIASAFQPWHGLDLLLESVASSNADFKLHLIGNVDVKLMSDSRIISHGHCNGDKIDSIVSQCTLGLSSFGLHRNNMQEACTLKTREYLQDGIPVYAGHRDVFPEDFKFFRNGPPDINSILDFEKTVCKHSRVEVAQAAQPYIGKDHLVRSLYSWLNHMLASTNANKASVE